MDISLLTELILFWGSGFYKYLAPNGAKHASFLRRNTRRSSGSQTSDRARWYFMPKPNPASVAGCRDSLAPSSDLPMFRASLKDRAAGKRDEKSA
jgi:hypothetical protein